MFGDISKSATRLVLLLMTVTLCGSLFLPVNSSVLPIFEKVLLVVIGAFFGMKISEKPGEDGLLGK